MTRALILILGMAALGLPACREAPPPAPPPDPAAAEVRAFLENYFAVWSANNMDGYGKLFAPEAVVHFAEKGGAVHLLPLGPFLESQKAAQAEHKMNEGPLSITVRMSPDDRVAQAAVRWKLVDGARTEIGWDHFTLLRHEGGWRIVSLLFYTE